MSKWGKNTGQYQSVKSKGKIVLRDGLTTADSLPKLKSL